MSRNRCGVSAAIPVVGKFCQPQTGLTWLSLSRHNERLDLVDSPARPPVLPLIPRRLLFLQHRMRQAISIESLLCSPTGRSNGPIEPPDDTLLKPAPLLVVLGSVWNIYDITGPSFLNFCSLGCLSLSPQHFASLTRTKFTSTCPPALSTESCGLIILSPGSCTSMSIPLSCRPTRFSTSLTLLTNILLYLQPTRTHPILAALRLCFAPDSPLLPLLCIRFLMYQFIDRSVLCLGIHSVQPLPSIQTSPLVTVPDLRSYLVSMDDASYPSYTSTLIPQGSGSALSTYPFSHTLLLQFCSSFPVIP